MIYEFLKKLIKKIFSAGFLVRNEAVLRKITFLFFYKGKEFYCNICNKGLKRFIILNNGDLLCPNCGSLGRNRKLWEILQNDLKNGIHILDFSPSRCIYRKLKKNDKINYTSSDFAGEFLSDVNFDITKINSPSESYDLIICYHILEHIDNDIQAMYELKRVLKYGGKCYIQTPFREGAIYENPTITSPAEKAKHFGQEDHVRIYSIDGLKIRLESCGLSVEIFNFENKKENSSGYNEIEHILCARKIN